MHGAGGESGGEAMKGRGGGILPNWRRAQKGGAGYFCQWEGAEKGGRTNGLDGCDKMSRRLS